MEITLSPKQVTASIVLFIIGLVCMIVFIAMQFRTTEPSNEIITITPNPTAAPTLPPSNQVPVPDVSLWKDKEFVVGGESLMANPSNYAIVYDKPDQFIRKDLAHLFGGDIVTVLDYYVYPFVEERYNPQTRLTEYTTTYNSYVYVRMANGQEGWIFTYPLEGFPESMHVYF